MNHPKYLITKTLLTIQILKVKCLLFLCKFKYIQLHLFLLIFIFSDKFQNLISEIMTNKIKLGLGKKNFELITIIMILPLTLFNTFIQI